MDVLSISSMPSTKQFNYMDEIKRVQPFMTHKGLLIYSHCKKGSS
jgi:hypothetical protein